MLYRLLFRYYLWRHVPDMGLRAAWNYPCGHKDGCSQSDDPFEDAREEMSYMADVW